MEQQQHFDKNNLNALINNTHDLMWSVNRDFKLITPTNLLMKQGNKFRKINRKRCRVFFSWQLIIIEMLLHFKELYERAFAGEIFTEIEHFNYPTEFWTEISYYPICQEDKIIGTACHSRDITEQSFQKFTNRIK